MSRMCVGMLDDGQIWLRISLIEVNFCSKRSGDKVFELYAAKCVVSLLRIRI